jgi:hypothetical protein
MEKHFSLIDVNGMSIAPLSLYLSQQKHNNYSYDNILQTCLKYFLSNKSFLFMNYFHCNPKWLFMVNESKNNNTEAMTLITQVFYNERKRNKFGTSRFLIIRE